MRPVCDCNGRVISQNQGCVKNRSWNLLRKGLICLALGLITLAVFKPSLTHDFLVYDDPAYVTENPHVQVGLTWQGVKWAFRSYAASNWHPVTWLSHMLDCQLYGLKPAGHHLTNVLLHAANTLLLFLVLSRMTGAVWRSACVAALFAWHPLHVESVAWVAERKDVLSALFFMLTLWAYARYAQVQSLKSKVQSRGEEVQGPKSNVQSQGTRNAQHAPRFYLLSLLCFALGLLSKPMLVTLPVVLLLLDFWPLGRMQNAEGRVQNAEASPTPDTRRSTLDAALRLLAEKLPFLAFSAISCLVTLLAQSNAMQSFESFPLLARIDAALLSCKVYLVQMIYPAGLAAFYPFPPQASTREAAMAGILLVVISAIAWGERRRRPWLLMGWLWYLVMLLPVLGLVQVGGQAHADRYTYLPQIGLYLAVTWLAADLAAKWQVGRMALGGLMAVVLAILMVGAWKQTAYWKNSETLWKHALACTTGNNLAYVNLGHELFEKGDRKSVV